MFWRKDRHLAAEGFGYREAGPHLMVMAFVQRIVNGGGRVECEYGLGCGALELMILMIFWKGASHAIEVKLRRDTETEAEALDQICDGADACVRGPARQLGGTMNAGCRPSRSSQESHD